MLTKKKYKTHSQYNNITVQFVNGKSFNTRSTYHSRLLKLEVDCTTHHAWTKKRFLANKSNNKVRSFNNKYSKFNFLG